MHSKKRFWLRLMIGVGLASAAFILGYFVGIPAYGAWQARCDISNGQARYLLHGELAPHEEEVASLIQQRYGVRLDRVAYCIVTDSLVRRCDAYNRRVNTHFGFTSGRDMFGSTLDELMTNEQKSRQ